MGNGNCCGSKNEPEYKASTDKKEMKTEKRKRGNKKKDKELFISHMI